MRRVFLLTLCFLLAGCTAPIADAPETTAEDEAATPEWSMVAPPGASNLTAATTLTGTFELQDSNRLPESPGTPQQVHDLSDLVPVGTLFRLVAEATAQTTGDIDIGISNGDGEGYEAPCECPIGNHNVLTYDGVMGDRLDVIIQYDETGQEPSFDYTIDITITGHGDAVPAGAPIGLNLAAGEALRFDRGAVAVWDADDVRVADLDGGTFIAQSDGEHAIMGLVPGGPLRIETNASDPSPRMLRTDGFRSDDWMPSGLEVNFTAPGGIIGLAVCLFVDEYAEDPYVRLTGPDGVVFEDSRSGPVVAGDWETCYETTTGDPTIRSGDYLLEADRERGVDGTVFYSALLIGR